MKKRTDSAVFLRRLRAAAPNAVPFDGRSLAPFAGDESQRLALSNRGNEFTALLDDDAHIAILLMDPPASGDDANGLRGGTCLGKLSAAAMAAGRVVWIEAL